MSNNDDDEVRVLRSVAHRMSQGVETKTRKYGLISFHNIFLGTVRERRKIYAMQGTSIHDERLYVTRVQDHRCSNMLPCLTLLRR